MKKVNVWDKPFLTVEEASAYTNIGPVRIRGIVEEAGPEVSFSVGKRTLIKKDGLMAWLNRKETV